MVATMRICGRDLLHERRPNKARLYIGRSVTTREPAVGPTCVPNHVPNSAILTYQNLC